MTKTQLYCNYVSVILIIPALLLDLRIMKGLTSNLETEVIIMFLCNTIQVIAFYFSNKDSRAVYLINGIGIFHYIFFAIPLLIIYYTLFNSPSRF